MGVVYKAEDTKLGRIVALKFLTPHLLKDEDARKRFEREARAAAALDHPNICTVYEIDQADGQTFIALAFLDGKTLRAKIAEGPLKIPEALSAATQLAEGLAAAHEQGVVHRDMKPDNVMLVKGSRGTAKIMDFGLAQLAGASKLTREGTTLGTMSYMSPEQAEGAETDHRSDIWSLGVILYEMVAGQAPFRGEFDQAIVYSLVNEDPEPLTAVRTGVPQELERIVGKALAKRPESRYQHVDEMLVDLRNLRAATAADQAAKAPPPASLPKSRLGWYALAGAAALAVALAVFQPTVEPEAQRDPPPLELDAKPLTGFRGKPFWPAFSPGGEQLAFSWMGRDPFNYDIYVRPLKSGEPRRLSSHSSDDFVPSWSPDGSSIVWLRELAGEGAGAEDFEIIEAPAVGGPERSWGRVSFNLPPELITFAGIAWTQDGEHLVVTEFMDGQLALYLRSRDGRRSRLTSPDAGDGDVSPALSPDGRWLAFVRGNLSASDIYLLELSDDGAAAGEPRRITEDRQIKWSLSWTPDGKSIVHVSPGMLWRVPVSATGARRQRLGAATGVGRVAVAPTGARLAFGRGSAASELYRMDVDGPPQDMAEPQRMGPSSGLNTAPDFSPDGRQLAFSASRDLYSGIFIADADGENVKTLYSSSSSIPLQPRWDPDGERIAFLVLGNPGTEVKSGVYVLAANGGAPLRISDAVGGPSWSSDGNEVYFASERTGQPEIWKQSLGGEPTQVTQDGGLLAIESPDGRFLYYMKTARGALFRMPNGGGDEEQVVEMVWDIQFEVLDDAVYYIAPSGGPEPSPFRIERYDVQDGRTEVMKVLPKEHLPEHGLTVSFEAGAIVYAHRSTEMEIMLVEGFE